MEKLLFIGILLLINHSCVLGNGSFFELNDGEEQKTPPYKLPPEYRPDTETNDVSNESELYYRKNFETAKTIECELPVNWRGQYFQVHETTNVTIARNTISGKGVCRENKGDKYVFVHETQHGPCYKCVVINKRHENIIQYKENGNCEDNATLEELCSNIGGDDPLITMFRENSQPVECPFGEGPFTFSYRKNDKECKSPVSRMETCSENWKLSLHYESCPDVTESQESSGQTCKFPKWMSSWEWRTLSGDRRINVQEKNSSFLVSRTRTQYGNSNLSEDIHPGILHPGTRVMCQRRVDNTQDHLIIAAKVTLGCKSTRICVHLLKRSEFVIEMQMETESKYNGEDFGKQCMNESLKDENSMQFLTLVRADASTTDCPFRGKFSVSGLTNHGQFVRNKCGVQEGDKGELNVIKVACEEPQSFDIYSKCSFDEELQGAQCIDHWKEDDKGFLIVSSNNNQGSFQSPAYCASYRETETELSFAISKTQCERILYPSVDLFSTFNATQKGDCVEIESLQISGAQRTRQCDITTFLLLLMSFVFMRVLAN